MKQEFKNYLNKKYLYSERTLQEKEKQLESWKKLCLKNQKLEKVTPKEVLNLIKIQKQQYTPQTLNNHLKTLEQYFYFLLETQKRKDLPLRNFRVLTDKKPILKNLFTEQELFTIYQNYTPKGHYGGQFNTYKQRNKVILGLRVFQALDSGTLEKLQLCDIDLEKGLIHIPKNTDYKLNPRILRLESSQILELHQYLTQTRKELLKLIKTPENSQKLFPKSEKTRFSHISQALKKQTGIENLQQLRYSRIAIWKKQDNLREVQYKAGYKSLLSLEKFDQDKLEELKQAVDKYHPLK